MIPFILMQLFNPKSLSLIRRIYLFTAITFLNAVFLLVIVNLLSQFVLTLWFPHTSDPLSRKYQAPLGEIYPHLDKSQIHQLLQENWRLLKFQFEPYTEFKVREFHGAFVNVEAVGFRRSLNQGPWPPQPQNYNIFVFGGSTTFGYGVSDTETIASFLQTQLQSQTPQPVKVYNFGRGYYYSTQELILFLTLLKQNQHPNLTIFVDGLNDFTYTQDEPALVPILKKYLEDDPLSFGLSKLIEPWPLTKLYSQLNSIRSAPIDFASVYYQDPQHIQQTANTYLTNTHLITTLSQHYHIQPFFVIQPVPTYKYNQQAYFFSQPESPNLEYFQKVYPQLQPKINFETRNLPRGKAGSKLETNFLWCADIQESLAGVLYVDKVHYSPYLNQQLAKCISASIHLK